MTPRKFEERNIATAHPVIPGLDYFGDWRPAYSVRGDLIEYFEMKDGNLGLAVGDVGGKGVPANLLKSSLQKMIRALRLARNFSLDALVRRADRLFCEIGRDRCYATLFVGEYDPSNGCLHYVNAGHEPPFVLRKNGGHFHTDFLEPGGPMIGRQQDSPHREEVVSLRPGDVLVAYTDGLCEMTNPDGEAWGWPRFLQTVEECADLRAQDMVEGVLQKADAFAGGVPPPDDATLFVGRVRNTIEDSPRYREECAVLVAA